MKQMKKILTYAVGATVIAGASAYMAMPKEAKQNLKDMIMNLTKRKKKDDDCCQN